MLPGDIILDGGTLDTDGFSNTAANLTLTGNSVIDLSGGTTEADLTFSGKGGAWDSSKTLAIVGWSGDILGSLTGTSLRFGADPSFSAAELANISINGGAAQVISNGGFWYLMPASAVPESSTWFGGGGLLALAVWHRWRRRKRTSG